MNKRYTWQGFLRGACEVFSPFSKSLISDPSAQISRSPLPTPLLSQPPPPHVPFRQILQTNGLHPPSSPTLICARKILFPCQLIPCIHVHPFPIALSSRAPPHSSHRSAACLTPPTSPRRPYLYCCSTSVRPILSSHHCRRGADATIGEDCEGRGQHRRDCVRKSV